MYITVVYSVKGAWPYSSPWTSSHLNRRWEWLVTALSSFEASVSWLIRSILAWQHWLWGSDPVETGFRGVGMFGAWV